MHLGLFTILLDRLERAAPAVEVAERICEMLGEPGRLAQHEVQISTSIGIAVATAARSRRAGTAARTRPETKEAQKKAEICGRIRPSPR